MGIREDGNELKQWMGIRENGNGMGTNKTLKEETSLGKCHRHVLYTCTKECNNYNIITLH